MGAKSLRIVVRSQDARLAREAQAQLAGAGIEAVALPGPLRLAPDGEDIRFVPLADPNEQKAAGDVEAGLIGAIIGMPSACPPRAGLDAIPGALGAVALDAPPALLAAQMAALVRLAVIEEERARRVCTAKVMGAALPVGPAPRKLRALYVGAPSPVFLSLERALSEHGGLVAAAFTSYSGFDHLHDQPFDAVVLNGAQDSATAISLCAALRRNASLCHMPTLVITAAGDATTAAAAIQRGASAVAEVNAPSGVSLAWLFEAIRRERRRASAEHDARALCDVIGDVRTGLFRRDAFDAHLARLAADHHASGRALSVAALRVMPAHGARTPRAEDWKRAFSESANLASRLVRDADCGATLGADLIVIALPAAGLNVARRMAERIASVAECTTFAAGEADVGPLVFEQTCAELQPGESGAGMLARVLRGFELESVPA